MLEDRMEPWEVIADYGCHVQYLRLAELKAEELAKSIRLAQRPDTQGQTRAAREVLRAYNVVRGFELTHNIDIRLRSLVLQFPGAVLHCYESGTLPVVTVSTAESTVSRVE